MRARFLGIIITLDFFNVVTVHRDAFLPTLHETVHGLFEFVPLDDPVANESDLFFKCMSLIKNAAAKLPRCPKRKKSQGLRSGE